MAAAASDGVDALGEGECRVSEVLMRGDEYAGGRESMSGMVLIGCNQSLRIDIIIEVRMYRISVVTASVDS